MLPVATRRECYSPPVRLAYVYPVQRCPAEVSLEANMYSRQILSHVEGFPPSEYYVDPPPHSEGFPGEGTPPPISS